MADEQWWIGQLQPLSSIPGAATVAFPFHSVTISRVDRVTTCLENLEMSGNLKHVREMSGIMLTVREMSGNKSCHGKVSQNCSLLDEYLCSYVLLST